MICILLASADETTLWRVVLGIVLAALVGTFTRWAGKRFVRMVGRELRDEIKAIAREGTAEELSAFAEKLTAFGNSLALALADIADLQKRETSAQLVEMRRIADAVARAASPARRTDPPDANYLHERALPPSEA